MNKKRWLFLIGVLLILALCGCLVACTGNNGSSETDPDDIDPTDPTVKTLTNSQALDKIYNGLISGGDVLKQSKTYGVETTYTAYTRAASGGFGLLNYTLTYKANYNENYPDSEIYIYVFDNNAHRERLVVYYDGNDLYVVSSEKRFVISGFSNTMMFNVFYEACLQIDLTKYFFGEEVGDVFNRNNNGLNLLPLIRQSNIKYRYAGDGNEVVEFVGIDGTILNDTVNTAMTNFFRGVGTKFDPISEKFLGFSVSRLAETRFSNIRGDLIQTRLSSNVANRMVWELSGKLADNITPYNLAADVGYNDGTGTFEEKSEFVKSTFTEASLGQNRFVGSIEIPAFSDDPYLADISTNISTADNLANEMSVHITDYRGTDFLSAYFKGGKAYVNATGIDDWLDGAINIDALNLPKIYFSDIDLSRMIGAGYNNVVKKMMNAVKKGFDGTTTDSNLYDTVMENFHNDGSYVYYIFTEEWYHKVSGDDESVMDKVAKLVGIERAQLASLLGEEFFLKAELEVGYDLDTGVLKITLREAKEVLFILTMEREEYRGVAFPADIGTSTYAPLIIPDVITLEFEAKLAVRNGQTSTDTSSLLGTLVGDASGENTKSILKNTETLIVEGAVSETFYVNAEGQTVTDNVIDISIYKEYKEGNANVRDTIATVRSNPNDRTELLVAYYLNVGLDLSVQDNADGLFYRIKKDTIKESFGELLGDGNVFSESNVLTILEKVVNSKGISQISKMNHWFNFSLVVSEKQDPVKDLIGLENTTATVKARVDFLGINNEIDMSKYVLPTVTPLENIVIGSVYEEASAWKDSVEVIVNNKVFHCKPNYTEESTTVVTGKTQYTPTAKIFGKVVTYTVLVTDPEGTYRVSRLSDPIIIIDPTENSHLPTQIEVVYDNGVRGNLACVIDGFEESNITLAGYNLSGFAGEFTDDMKSRVTIGVDSIMNVTFDAYILVQNRKVIPEKGENGLPLNDGNGVPVVGVLHLDPYTYAMRLRDDSSYDPIVDGLRRDNTELKFENVYGQEEVADGDSVIVRDLTYDAIGYNRFILADLGLTWEYGALITWQGSSGYAYATFGSENGEALKIAVKVLVAAQRVDHVQIDDEDNGVYTIDFLQRATYTVPTQGDATNNHVVKIYFKGSDDSNQKFRYVTLTRPAGLTDDEYHDDYLAVTLNWNGIAEEIVANPYLIAANTNEKEHVSATFGSTLGVGEQTVDLTVEIPDRTQDTSSSDPRYIATSCEVDLAGDPVFTKHNVSPSKAYFPRTDGVDYTFYEALRINPYDAAFRLPDEVYLEVPKVSGYRTMTTVKRYAVEWVTTDKEGNELNLIETKYGGGYGLKHPVTEETDMVVYGKIGDRGNEPGNSRNLGYVWIAMIIKNEESKLRSISYSGLNDGVTVIENVDPYGEYTLPYSFVAVLESGRRIERYGVEWEVRVEEDGDYVWYPVNYVYGSGAPAEYYKDGRFVFNRTGGLNAIRYVIEGDSESIRQTLTLNVDVLQRTIVSDRVDIYAQEGNQPQQGYEGIDVYEASSTTLYERISAIDDGQNLAGIAFAETGSGGLYVPSYLAVDWLRASQGEGGYRYSLDYLMRLLTSSDAVQELLDSSIDGTMYLSGTIYTGTVNEQSLSITFSFADRKIAALSLDRMAYAQEKNAVRVGTIDEHTASVMTFADDNERRTNRTVAFDGMGEPRTLNIRLDKPFALTYPNGDSREVYASPTAYFTYLLGLVRISFTGSAVDKQVTPVLSFDVTKEVFDSSVLEISGAYVKVTFRMEKLSAGSAIDPIVVNVYSLKDVRLDDSDAITPELFDETGAELYSESRPYRLPTYIDVAYQNSGVVRYEVDAWTVEGAGMAELFSEDGKTSVIEAKLINTIRSTTTDKQNDLYNFAYDLPCVDATYRITVYIPKKNIREVYYRANGETPLYNIENGVLTIDNPYLYYDPDVENVDGKKYGFDVSKIPSKIIPTTNEFDFLATEVTSYDVSWNFIEGVFTSDLFATGTDGNVLLATAILPAYYDGNYTAQRQTVKLYLKINALAFDGIAREDITVVSMQGSAVENVIEIDPYNDINGYAGRFNMPTTGLTVRFGAESYVFDGVEFYLRSKTGTQYANRITVVEYDETGHLFSQEDYPDLREDGILEFNMYLPGFGLMRNDDGTVRREESKSIRIYLNVLSKVIRTAYVPNVVYDAAGLSTGEVVQLPSIYYIDPYNSATYALPSKLSARFEGYAEDETITVSGWEIYDETEGKWKDFSTQSSATFYQRVSETDSAVNIGFYNPGPNGYKGHVYENIRGYISMGRSVSGEVTKQPFKVTVIVLNRSLKETYTTSYRYNDPFGGLLSDIGGVMDADMFVAYEKYYEEYFDRENLPDEYKYDSFATPIIPVINWSVYNDESVVEPFGGFDKQIVGNAYFGASHRDNDYLASKAIRDAEYEQLARALIWDSYFTAGGYPLAYYSANTIANLNTLSAALKNRVTFRTYEILTERLANSADETKKQFANYLSNGLVNEIVAEYNLSRETQMEKIAVTMYGLLKSEYEGGNGSERAGIYPLWQEVYEEFINAGSDVDPNLSEYQSLKAQYYALANDDSSPTFTEQEKTAINAGLRKNAESKLDWYKKAAIYDDLYNTATAKEREVMSRFLLSAEATDQVFEGVELSIIYRAVALSVYIRSTLSVLGSAGEEVYARISAPELTLGDIYDLTSDNGAGGYDVLTTYLFNMYNEEPFLTTVGVGFIANYANLYRDYIEEGIRLAIEEYRALPEAQRYSLTEFVAERTAYYVNAIVPYVTIPGSGGQEEPLIDFTYDGYASLSAEKKAEYWKKLYDRHEKEANDYLDLYDRYDTYQEKWTAAYQAHVLRGDTDILERMDDIWEEKQHDTGLSAGEGRYQAAFNDYGALIVEWYLSDMLPHLEAAEISANAQMADEIFNERTTFDYLKSSYSTYDNVFSTMYGQTMIDAYDILYKSFDTDELRSTYQPRLDAVYEENSFNKGATMHVVIRSQTIDTEIVTRAKYIYTWILGGASAWDVLYENAESVGYTQELLDELKETALANNGYLQAARYNVSDQEGAAFSVAEYATFVNVVLLERVIDKTTNVTAKNKITAWRDAAIQKAKSDAFIHLHDVDAANADNIYQTRDTVGQVKKNAFDGYVAAQAALGEALGSDIDAYRTYYLDRAVFDGAVAAVDALLENNAFEYKGYLQPNEEKVAEYKGLAIEYFVSTFATEREKVILCTERDSRGSGTLAYDALLARADVEKGTKDALRNAYATVLLNAAFDGIKESIEASIRERIENNSASEDATYDSIDAANVDLFKGIASALPSANLTAEQTLAVQEVNVYDYVRTIFTQKTTAYTTFVNGIRSGAQESADGYAYEKIYEGNESVFDAILDEYYLALATNPLTASDAKKNYKAYNYLAELLTKEEIALYAEATQEIIDTRAKATLYSGLGRYAKESAYDAAAGLIDSYRAVYEGFSEEERAALDTVAGLETLFDIENERDLLSAILDRYAQLSATEVDDPELRALLDTLLAGMDEASVAFVNAAGTSVETALNVAVAASANEQAYKRSAFSADAKNVLGAVAIADLLLDIDARSDGIDRDCLSKENLAGDFTVTGQEYDAAYVTILAEAFSAHGLLSAKTYVDVTLQAYANDLSTDEELAESVGAAITAGLLLTSDGQNVRQRFANQISAYEQAIEEGELYLAKKNYYNEMGALRMIDADGSELYSLLYTAYNDLTADQKASVAPYFDSSVLTDDTSPLADRYDAFLAAFDAVIAQLSGVPSLEILVTAFTMAATTYKQSMSNSTYAAEVVAAVQDDTDRISRAAGTYDVNGSTVSGAVAIAKAMVRLLALRSTISNAYLTVENVENGDYTTTTDGYKEVFVNNLLTVFTERGYVSAVAAVQERLTAYAESIADDDELNAVLRELVAAKLSRTYSTALTNKMMTLFSAGRTDLDELLADGYAIVDIEGYLSAKRGIVESTLSEYKAAAGNGTTDADYQRVFNAMLADGEEEIKVFITDVYTDNDDLNLGASYFADRVGRYGVIFDATGLTQSNDNTADGSIYILNGYKMDEEQVRLDGKTFRFSVISPCYVDYYDVTYLGVDNSGNPVIKYVDGATTLVNTLTIDPLMPALPARVKAYGKYEQNGVERLYDLGSPMTRYEPLFYQNVYTGQAQNDTDYTVYLIDSRFNEYGITISVTYLDATIEKVSVSDMKNYGGTEDLVNANYYSLYDETTHTNRITINPVNEDIIDIENKKYVLPTDVLVTYANLTNEDGSQKQALLKNIVWDSSSIRYTLLGQTGVKLRPLSYVVTIDGVDYTITFTYGTNGTLTFSGNGNTGTMQNAPGYEVFNLVLDVNDQTVTKLSIRGEDRELFTFGTYDSENGYVDVPDSVYTLNPFDIQYPDRLVLDFFGGDQKDYAIPDWDLEPGASGKVKMGDIIMKNAYDFHVVAQFTYLGYTVRVRFVVDDIRIEATGSDSSSYIDGGTIYLVAGGGSASRQLAENYSYLYYNFGTGNSNDYRKVALSFNDISLMNISTESIRRYENVLGVLGWDKQAYPNLNVTNNISFTIEIVNPQLFAKWNDEYYRYVGFDYSSVPYDNNFQKANYSESPQGTAYESFVHFTYDGQQIFAIDPDATVYDVLAGTVTYRCVFYLNGGNYRVVADENGNRAKSFSVTLPMDGYLYTSVSDAKFDPTPITDLYGAPIWTWAGNDYADAIRWPLGRTLKASELPRLRYVYEDEEYFFKPMWDLTDLNVNRATGAGYVIRCYYYDKNGMWKELSLTVYIDKIDISDDIRLLVGGSLSINETYDAHYYVLPIYTEYLYELREDGHYLALDDSAIDIRYKPSSAPEREYSSTNLPIDVGTYDVKVSITDYNVMLQEELIFHLTIEPIRINVSDLVFENRISNAVEYVYDGKAKPLTVLTGLPSVTPDNWFASQEEKQQLIAEQYALVPTYTEVQAKSHAYLELFSRVPRGAKNALSELSRKMRADTGLKDDELNAAVFDYLTPDFTFIEVVTAVTYTQGDKVIGSVPVDVGAYTAVFSLDDAANLHNYELSAAQVGITFNITQPTVNYSLVSNELTYCGALQNPLISGLHDSDGKLPVGVKVTYTYKYTVSGRDYYLTGGIIDVGTYLCEIKIEGGNNFPSAMLDAQTVTIVPKTLLIRLGDVGSDYLQSIADLQSALEFDGLVGSDRANVFGYVDVNTEAKSYYTIGEYAYAVDGFRIDETYEETYAYVAGEETINGVLYKNFKLKPASGVGNSGNLYAYTNEDGSYSFADLIAKFTNYDVYVQKVGRYVVSVAGGTGATVRTADADSTSEALSVVSSVQNGERLEVRLAYDVGGDPVEEVYRALNVSGKATVVLYRYNEERTELTCLGSVRSENGQKVKVYEVSTDAELSAAIPGAKNGARVEIYLKSGVDGENNLVEKTYSAVEMNVAGSVLIYGCYDQDRNIVTYLNGIVVKDGALDLRIVGFRTAGNASVCVDVRSGADDVRISEDCRFDSVNGDRNTVGVRTDNNYAGSLTISGCTFNGFRRAVESVNGSLRVEETGFAGNYIALSIESSAGDVNVLSNRFLGNEVGIVVKNGNTNVRFNTFARNSVGIVVDDEISTLPELTEDMLVSRNNTNSGEYFFDDTNIVKVATGTEWAALQQNE